jgi:hypothetical protein
VFPLKRVFLSHWERAAENKSIGHISIRTLAELRENPSSIRVDAVLGFNFYKP